MTYVTRISLLVGSWFVAAFTHAVPVTYVGNLNDAQPPNYPKSNSVGVATAYVFFDVSAKTLAITVRYTNLNTGIATVSISKVNTATMPPTLDSILASLKVEPTGEKNDQSELATSPRALSDSETRAISDALAQGTAYLSIDTMQPAEIRGPLQMAALVALTKVNAIEPSSIRMMTIGSSTLNCGSKVERCVVPLLAYSDANGNCWVYSDIETIFIPRTMTPRIVWMLVNRDVKDPARYRFTPGGGIKIARNDPSKDYNGQDNDSWDERRYKVNSVHAQPSSLKYRILVERYDAPNDTPLGCTMADPTVTNE